MVTGSHFHWKYTLSWKYKNRQWTTSFDDQMWLHNDQTLINRAVIKKYGITLGQAWLIFYQSVNILTGLDKILTGRVKIFTGQNSDRSDENFNRSGQKFDWSSQNFYRSGQNFDRSGQKTWQLLETSWDLRSNFLPKLEGNRQNLYRIKKTIVGPEHHGF